jgi:membrane protein
VSSTPPIRRPAPGASGTASTSGPPADDAGSRQITSRLPKLPRGSGAGAQLLRGLYARRLIANYLRDDGDGLATIIAFNALFSLLPFLLILFTLVSLFVQSNTIHNRIQRLVVDLLPSGSSQQVLDVVEQGRNNLGQLTIVAAVSLVVGGSRFFSSLDNAFARIYRIQRRSYLERKFAALVMVPLVSVLMIGAAAASTVATVMIALPERLSSPSNARWLSAAVTLTISYFAAYIMALVLYSMVPNYHRSRRIIAWPGSLVGAALYVLLSQLFPLYMRLTGGFGIFGSAFAFALVLMVWLYLLGQIIVIGAEVNALAGGRRDIPLIEIDVGDAV